MGDRTKKVLATVGFAALIMVGTDAMTYAGTGDSLILGKVNKSKKTTHVISTGNGPALSLQAKGNRAALKVDSKAKVVKLNADLVDGKDASSLQNNVRVYTATSGKSVGGVLDLQLPSFPKGRYEADYSIAMIGASGTTANPTTGVCAFRRMPELLLSGYTMSTSVAEDVGLSGSAVISNDGSTWSLRCLAKSGSAARDWSIHADIPARVTLTKIDRTIGGKLTNP